MDLTGHQEVRWVVRQTGHLHQVLEVLQVSAAVVELAQLRELLEEPGGVARQGVGGQVLVQEEQQLHCVVIQMDAVLNIPVVSFTGWKSFKFSNKSIQTRALRL